MTVPEPKANLCKAMILHQARNVKALKMPKQLEDTHISALQTAVFDVLVAKTLKDCVFPVLQLDKPHFVWQIQISGVPLEEMIKMLPLLELLNVRKGESDDY